MDLRGRMTVGHGVGEPGGAPEAGHGTGRTSIIVVDDDQASRLLAAMVLEKAGWVVHQAWTANECLKLVAAHAASFVLTDVRMPGGNGLDLAGALARAHPEIRLVAMTAYPGDLDVALASGVFEGVIEKPIDVETFAGSIDWLFFRRHLV